MLGSLLDSKIGGSKLSHGVTGRRTGPFLKEHGVDLLLGVRGEGHLLRGAVRCPGLRRTAAVALRQREVCRGSAAREARLLALVADFLCAIICLCAVGSGVLAVGELCLFGTHSLELLHLVDEAGDVALRELLLAAVHDVHAAATLALEKGSFDGV